MGIGMGVWADGAKTQAKLAAIFLDIALLHPYNNPCASEMSQKQSRRGAIEKAKLL
jgi:hypothetical protein